MKIDSLGHVFLKVRDQERAEAFYNGVLGIPIVGKLKKPPMTFFSLGNHHDFGILATSNGPSGSAAVSGFSTGAAHAVTGIAAGTGRAGMFQIANGSSSATALYCSTIGTGLAFQAGGKSLTLPTCLPLME